MGEDGALVVAGICKPKKLAKAAVAMAPSLVISDPFWAFVVTMVGIDAKPKRVNNCVFLATAALGTSMSRAAVIPPALALIDASCASMAASGSGVASIVAPCAVLDELRIPTGIHKKRI